MTELDELDRCRLCSSQNNLTDIFGVPNKDDLFRMIYACTSIRITFERDFPGAVCTSCIRIVKQFYSYRQKCLDHNRNLKRLRGEDDEEEENDDDSEEDDPLKSSKKRKHEREVRDRKFYDDVKKYIQGFLAGQVKEVERKALEKVNDALKLRKNGRQNAEEVLLQMTVEPADAVCEEVEYEVLSDSEGFCPQQQQQEEYKMELESVYFEASDHEDMAESEFAGFEEQTPPNKNAPVGVGGTKGAGNGKRKRSTENVVVSTQTKVLEKQLSEAQKKIDTLVQLGQELELKRMKLQTGGPVVSTRFTTEEDIPITVEELETMNERSSSDSVFVGMLITRLIDPNELMNMSVTGHASHRFAKLKKPDGSPLYPPTEKIDPRIFDFVCNKVAERTAMRIGPEDIHTIRKNSEERIIKRFIAQKIGNLKKAGIVRRSRTEGEQSWSETSE